MKGRYRYRARDHKGQRYEGVVEAVSREAALERLLLDRLFVDELVLTEEPPPAAAEPPAPSRSPARPRRTRAPRQYLLAAAAAGCFVLALWDSLPGPAPPRSTPRVRLVVQGPLTGSGPLRFSFPELPLTLTRTQAQVGRPGRRFELELLLETERVPTVCRVEAQGAEPLEVPVTVQAAGE